MKRNHKPSPLPSAVHSLVANLRAARPIAEQPGPITFEVGNAEGNVLIRFVRPITNLALSPEQAKQFAKLLLQQAVKQPIPESPT